MCEELECIDGTILIVDDEENILKSLRRQLMAEDFNILTATNAIDALKILQEEKVDIVISDLRMPRMDGITFLSVVKKEYPEVERIILTGFLDETTVLQSITKGIATSYFTKPWDINFIVQSLKQFLQNKQRFRGKQLLSKLSQIEELPTSPEIYRSFMDALNMDKSMREIEQILQRDVSLTAKILQVANSAFYGIRPTSSLLRAMMVVGLDAVRDIVLTFSLINQMRWTPRQMTFLEEICNHSFVVNKYFPTFYKLKTKTALHSQYTSVGITHDIGKIILLQYFPEVFEQIIKTLKENPEISFYESELELGYSGETHSELGAYFLKSWDLPDMSANVALYHHTPDSSGVKNKELMNIFHYTDQFVDTVCSAISGKPDVRSLSRDWIPLDEVKQYSEEITRSFDETNIFG